MVLNTFGALEQGYARLCREANLQRLPGKFTITTTVALPVVATALVLSGVLLPFAPFAERAAEVIAVFSLAYGWRFRRSRLVLTALTLAFANYIVRTWLSVEIDVGTGPSLAALSIILPLDLAVMGVLSDRKVSSWSTLAVLAVIAAQPFLVIRLLNHGDPTAWTRLLATPQASHLTFLIATGVAVVAFTIRRGVFELGLFGVLASCALGLLGWPGLVETTTFFATAQLVLLFGLIEDSYELAFVDGLTGLPGRRAFDEALNGLAGDYTLAMIDIDHFKRFNDRYGHEAGDQALRMVAQCLQKTGGRTTVYRYGGEEFAAVFPSLSVSEAGKHLDEVRRLIAGRSFSIRSSKRPKTKPDHPKPPRKQPAQARLTVSIGAAGPSSLRVDREDVLRAADKALYRAKRAGRNRLVTA